MRINLAPLTAAVDAERTRKYDRIRLELSFATLDEWDRILEVVAQIDRYLAIVPDDSVEPGVIRVVNSRRGRVRSVDCRLYPPPHMGETSCRSTCRP